MPQAEGIVTAAFASDDNVARLRSNSTSKLSPSPSTLATSNDPHVSGYSHRPVASILAWTASVAPESYCQLWCTGLESGGFPADFSLIDTVDELHSGDDVGELLEAA